jgi:hypothetical protein
MHVAAFCTTNQGAQQGEQDLNITREQSKDVDTKTRKP